MSERGRPVSAVEAAELDAALRHGSITTVYQSIVELEGLRVVAFEALARGPEGSVLASPDRLFTAARSLDRLAELDWRCRVAAVDGAVAAGLPAGCSLFV